jgi:hypothetical protein
MEEEEEGEWSSSESDTDKDSLGPPSAFSLSNFSLWGSSAIIEYVHQNIAMWYLTILDKDIEPVADIDRYIRKSISYLFHRFLLVY